MKAGDVVFFNGHVLHRSKQDWSQDRFRRAFAGHYCNARSYTQWGTDRDVNGNRIQDRRTGATNGAHILARGDTHLPFAKPRFGTPCAALLSREQRSQHAEYAARVIASMNDGLMGCAISDLEELDRQHEAHESGEGYRPKPIATHGSDLRSLTRSGLAYAPPNAAIQVLPDGVGRGAVRR